MSWGLVALRRIGCIGGEERTRRGCALAPGGAHAFTDAPRSRGVGWSARRQPPAVVRTSLNSFFHSGSGSQRSRTWRESISKHADAQPSAGEAAPRAGRNGRVLIHHPDRPTPL